MQNSDETDIQLTYLKSLNTAASSCGVISLTTLSDQRVASSGKGGITLWNVDNDEFKIIPDSSGKHNLTALQKNLLASTSKEIVQIWNTDTSKCLFTLQDHKEPISSLAYVSSERLVSVSEDKTLKIWDISDNVWFFSNRCKKTINFKHEVSTVNSQSILAYTDSAIISVGSGGIFVWDLATGEIEQSFKRENNNGISYTDITDLNDGRIAVSRITDTGITLWDLKAGKISQALDPHDKKERGGSLKGLQDGSLASSVRIYSGLDKDRRKPFKIWDLRNGKFISAPCISHDVDTISAKTNFTQLDDGRLITGHSIDYEAKSKSLHVWKLSKDQNYSNKSISKNTFDHNRLAPPVAKQKFALKPASLEKYCNNRFDEELLKAASAGEIEKMDKCLASGATLKARDEIGNTALLKAACKGHLSAIKWLVDIKKCPLEEKNNQGDNALRFAVCFGHLILAKWLVDEKKMSLIDKNDNDDTLLMWAINNGQVSIMKWLVDDKGIDIYQKNNAGATALVSAAVKGDVAIFQWFLDKNTAQEDNSFFFLSMGIAANNGHLQIVKLLSEKVETFQNDFESIFRYSVILLAAAKFGHISIVKWIIEEKRIVFSESINDYIRNQLKEVDSKEIVDYLTKFLNSQSALLTPIQTHDSIEVKTSSVISTDAHKSSGNVANNSSKTSIIKSPNGEADFNRAEKYYIEKNFEKAKKYYTFAAEKHYSGAEQKLKDIDILLEKMKLENNKLIPPGSVQSSNSNMSYASSRILDSVLGINRRRINDSSTVHDKEIIYNDQIKFSSIQLGRRINAGGFGVVYEAVFKGKTVAVKQLLNQQINDSDIEDFKKEVAHLSTCQSPNIIKFFGACLERNHLSIIMEFMPRGSLYSYAHSTEIFPWDIRYQISIDIALGLSYLHGRDVIHCDVRSPNVLLDENMKAKICDFGLAKTKSANSSFSTIRAQNPYWQAPELVIPRAKPDQRSDVYSYGIVLYEICSRKKPFDGLDPIQMIILLKDGGEVERSEKEQMKKLLEKDTPPTIAKLLGQCWDRRAEARPTINQAVKLLQDNMPKYNLNKR